MKFSIKYLSILCVFSLNGCLSLSHSDLANNENKKFEVNYEEINLKKHQDNRNYSIINTPYSDHKPISVNSKNIRWLKQKKVSLNFNVKNKVFIPFKDILKQLIIQGVNIVPTISIEGITYSGYPIASGTDAYTAMQILTSSVGMDFKIINNGVSRYVQISEMGTDSFSLVVPDVKSALEMISGNDSSDTNDTDSSSDSSSDESDSSETKAKATADNKTEFKQNFWGSLEEELKSQMTIMIPKVNNSLHESNEYRSNEAEDKGFSGYNEIKVGRVTLNPATGNISITGPKYIRDRILKYLKNLDYTLNTRIQTVAKIIYVNRSDSESSGINISSLINLKNGYEFLVGNNPLGNVVISEPSTSNGFSVSSSNSISSSLIGMRNTNGKFQTFMNYMKSIGTTKSLCEINSSVRSGRTVSISQNHYEPRINSSSTSTTTDGGTTTGGTTNSITNFQTGIVSNITPVYDPKKGVVHSLITVKLVLDAGETIQEEPITSGDSIEIIKRKLNNTDVITLQTETLSKDGELVIAGGITTSLISDNNSGTRGLKDSFAGGIFGNAQREVQYRDYYIVLETKVIPYGQIN